MSALNEQTFHEPHKQLSEIQALEQQLVQQQQISFNLDNDDGQSLLQSLSVHPHYDWSPNPLLQECLDLDRDLFRILIFTNTPRSDIIDKYPPIQSI